MTTKDSNPVSGESEIVNVSFISRASSSMIISETQTSPASPGLKNTVSFSV